MPIGGAVQQIAVAQVSLGLAGCDGHLNLQSSRTFHTKRRERENVPREVSRLRRSLAKNLVCVRMMTFHDIVTMESLAPLPTGDPKESKATVRKRQQRDKQSNIANLPGRDSVVMPRTFARRHHVHRTIANQSREFALRNVIVRCEANCDEDHTNVEETEIGCVFLITVLPSPLGGGFSEHRDEIVLISLFSVKGTDGASRRGARFWSKHDERLRRIWFKRQEWQRFHQRDSEHCGERFSEES